MTRSHTEAANARHMTDVSISYCNQVLVCFGATAVHQDDGAATERPRECISSLRHPNGNMFLFIYLSSFKPLSKYSPLSNCTCTLSGSLKPRWSGRGRTRGRLEMDANLAELLSTLLLVANTAPHLRWQRVGKPIKALTTSIVAWRRSAEINAASGKQHAKFTAAHCRSVCSWRYIKVLPSGASRSSSTTLLHLPLCGVELQSRDLHAFEVPRFKVKPRAL